MNWLLFDFGPVFDRKAFDARKFLGVVGNDGQFSRQGDGGDLQIPFADDRAVFLEFDFFLITF
jgi:hypothetical protein